MDTPRSHSGSPETFAGQTAETAESVHDVSADADDSDVGALDTSEPVVRRSSRQRGPPDRFGQWVCTQTATVEPDEIFV